MNVAEVLDALKKAQQSPVVDPLNKAWTTALGIVNYDLQRPALALYPWGEMITPLRVQIARVTSKNGDTATRWKAITGINTTNLPAGVSEGNRSGVINTTTASYTAAYVGLGLEDYVTFEEDYASEGFQDARATAVEGVLRSVMITEEKMILGGNSSVALGITPTPVDEGSATGGALSDATYYVACVALTADGYSRATVAAGVVQQIVRTNADGSSDTINGGTAQRSAASAGVILNAGTAVQSINASVTVVRGAVAYAWYLGTSATVMYLQQITTLNSVNFTTALVTSTQAWGSLVVDDFSDDGTYSFDGLLYSTGFKSGSGGYYAALATGTNGAGTKLTTDSAGGVTEINTMFQSMWDNYRLGPDTIWVSAQQAIDITGIVINRGGAPLVRMNMDANVPNLGLVGGMVVSTLVNKFTNQTVRVRIHPNMPAGTILATSKTIPYPLSGVGNVVQMKCRREFYQTEWPLRTRKYEFGVYVDEVLQMYFAPAFGVITNIAPGFATS